MVLNQVLKLSPARIVHMAMACSSSLPTHSIKKFPPPFESQKFKMHGVFNYLCNTNLQTTDILMYACFRTRPVNGPMGHGDDDETTFDQQRTRLSLRGPQLCHDGVMGQYSNARRLLLIDICKQYLCRCRSPTVHGTGVHVPPVLRCMVQIFLQYHDKITVHSELPPPKKNPQNGDYTVMYVRYIIIIYTDSRLRAKHAGFFYAWTSLVASRP